MPINIDFPYQFDARGRTATTTDDDHIRDMIEELLFTNPGERVNRPDFGSGLMQLVFAPNSPELAAALQFTMQAALQRYLGDLIDLQTLEVTAADAALTVVVKYVVRRTQETQT
jgi:Bacteriophage baseplate protein W